eukprot:5593798-Lingulodinium_polyedra.AAC.1
MAQQMAAAVAAQQAALPSQAAVTVTASPATPLTPGADPPLPGQSWHPVVTPADGSSQGSPA